MRNALIGGARAVTLALVCASCAGARIPPAEIHGRVASGGGFLGDWDFYPASCAVHDDEVVLIESPSSLKRIRLVDRTRVSRGSPGSPGASARNAKIDVHVAKQTDTGSTDLVFTDPDCVQSTLEGGPLGYRGEVSLDCKTGEGGHVIGKITFRGCT